VFQNQIFEVFFFARATSDNELLQPFWVKNAFNLKRRLIGNAEKLHIDLITAPGAGSQHLWLAFKRQVRHESVKSP
jgi:hypothetical protein